MDGIHVDDDYGGETTLNLTKISSLIREHRRYSNQCEGCSGIFFLGETGVGKSCTINYVAGRSMTYSRVQSGDFDIGERIDVEDCLEGCEVGHDADSMTRFCRCYPDECGQTFLCDTPGFNDTEGSEVDIANAVAISSVMRESSSVRLVLIVHEASIFSSRGGCLKKLFLLLTRLVKNVDDHLNSIIVLFTHANKSHQELLHYLLSLSCSKQFSSTKNLLKHVTDLIERHGELLILRPAGDAGKARLADVRNLIYSACPITNTVTALTSPLTEDLTGRVVHLCTELAARVERDFRAMRCEERFKDYLDDLEVLGGTLNVEVVQQRYLGLCSVLAEQYFEVCEQAKKEFRYKDFASAHHFEKLAVSANRFHTHFSKVRQPTQSEGYPSFLKEVNLAVEQCSTALLSGESAAQNLHCHLDILRGIDNCLRHVLHPSHRDAYKLALESVNSRFCQVFDSVMRLIDGKVFETDELTEKLDFMQEAQQCQEHFDVKSKWELCLCSLEKLVDSSFTFCMSCVKEILTEDKAAEYFSNFLSLHTVSKMPRHVLDGSVRYLQCLESLREVSDAHFIDIDTYLAKHRYQDVSASLFQLQFLNGHKDTSLQQRFQAKIDDIILRIENMLLAIRTLLGIEIPTDHEYSKIAENVNYFLLSLRHLTPFLKPEGLSNFEQEKEMIFKELESLYLSIRRNAVQALTMELSDSVMEVTVVSSENLDLLRFLEAIRNLEFMLSLKIEFETDLENLCNDFVNIDFVPFFKTKCKGCVEKASTASHENAGELLEEIKVLKKSLEQFEKCQSKGETFKLLMEMWSNESFHKKSSPREQEVNKPVQDASVQDRKSLKKKNSRKKRNSAGQPPLSYSMDEVQSAPFFSAKRNEKMDSSTKYDFETLIAELQDAINTSRHEIEKRVGILENDFKEQNAARNVSAVKDILFSFHCLSDLESVLPIGIPKVYTSCISQLKQDLVDIQNEFDRQLRADNMESAHTFLNQVAEMQCLQDHTDVLEVAHTRMTRLFQEKTNRFGSTVNELIEARKFSKLAATMKGHRQIEHNIPSASHEFDCAFQQIKELFNIKFQSARAIIQTIQGPKPALLEHKVLELDTLLKDFVDAESLFAVFGENNELHKLFVTLNQTLKSRLASLVEHGEACIRKLDFKKLAVCMEALESLRFLTLVSDEVHCHIENLATEAQHKIESLNQNLIAAIEAGEYLKIDKIFNGIKCGTDVSILEGIDFTEVRDNLQRVLVDHLQSICRNIQQLIDDYDIRSAHKNILSFQKLLVSEAAKATEVNGTCLAKFQAEMDEIKKEILTPSLLCSNPAKICLCLEGFKEVDPRFYRRQCDHFLQSLKTEVDICAQEILMRDEKKLKGLDKMMKSFNDYEIALKGQECDSKIKELKKSLFDCLVEAYTEATEEIVLRMSKSRWDEIEPLKRFLKKLWPILQNCDLADECVKTELVQKFASTNARIQEKAVGISTKWDIIQALDLKDTKTFDATVISKFLDELKKDETLLDCTLVKELASQSISLQNAVSEIRLRISSAIRDFDVLWTEKRYSSICNILFHLESLCKIECLQRDAVEAVASMKGKVNNKLDILIQDALNSFGVAIKTSDRSAFHRTNEILEEIHGAQCAFVSLAIVTETREENAVTQIVLVLDQEVEKFNNLFIRSLEISEAVIVVLNLWSIVSQISNQRVQDHGCCKIRDVFHTCSSAYKKRGKEFDFSALATKLAELDAKGGEIVEAFSEVFKGFLAMKFRNATSRMTFADALDKLATLNALTAEQKHCLAAAYSCYEERFKNLRSMYSDIAQAKSCFMDEQSCFDDNVFAQVSRLESREAATTFNVEKVPRLLASIFAAWSIHASAGSESGGGYPTPHPVQNFFNELKARLRSMFTDKKESGGNDGHLVQLKTGEGKSLVLGGLATSLAMMGFTVDCVCYSSYLSKRDYMSFEPIFRAFGVRDQIRYDTFTTLSTRLIASICDVRAKSRCFLMGSNPSSEGSTERESDSNNKILLIDEVDVFFSEEFYGRVYSASVSLNNDNVEEIQRSIWNMRTLPPADIQACIVKLDAYRRISSEMPFLITLLDRHIKEMVSDVRVFEGERHEYQIDKTGRIAYANHDSASANIVKGYMTLFAHFKEMERGRVSSETLQSAMGLQIKCGNFSFADIPKFYRHILGVTGTLESLSEFEKNVVRSDYGIKGQTLTPSIYGDSQLTFRENMDVHVEIDAALHNRRVKEEILRATEAGRAVLVFFESEKRLMAWMNSGYAGGIENLSFVTRHTENVDHYVRLATRAQAVTLFSAVHGRGLDFVCHDKEIDAKGGVHVVQTFLSEQRSEEIQIKGRTARQGKKGTFCMVLLASDVERFGVTMIELEEARRSGKVFDVINAKRNAWFNDKSARRSESIVCARKLHDRSLRLQHMLLDYYRSRPEKRTEKAEQIREMLETLHDLSGGRCRLLCLSDATGSMESLWASSKAHIFSMLSRIDEVAGKGFVQMRWVAYRDYDQVRARKLLESSGWTRDAGALRSFLDGVRCCGGGDFEEAIEAALEEANRDAERPTRVLLIGDAPPHHEKRGQRLSDHDYVLTTDWEIECAKLAKKGVPVYTFQVGNNKDTEEAFADIARRTGGTFKPLKSADDLLDVVCLQALDQVGGTEMVDKYRERYMGFTYSS